MTTDFHKVVRRFGVDEVEGGRFIARDGTRLLIKWPNGEESYEDLTVRKGYESVHFDMFAPEISMPTEHFVVVKKLHGIEFDIPLLGLMVARVK